IRENTAFHVKNYNSLRFVDFVRAEVCKVPIEGGFYFLLVTLEPITRFKLRTIERQKLRRHMPRRIIYEQAGPIPFRYQLTLKCHEFPGPNKLAGACALSHCRLSFSRQALDLFLLFVGLSEANRGQYHQAKNRSANFSFSHTDLLPFVIRRRDVSHA